MQKSRKPNTSGRIKRRGRRVPKDPTRSVAAKEVAAARIISRRGPPGAATRSRKTMIMTRIVIRATTSSRKL